MSAEDILRIMTHGLSVRLAEAIKATLTEDLKGVDIPVTVVTASLGVCVGKSATVTPIDLELDFSRPVPRH